MSHPTRSTADQRPDLDPVPAADAERLVCVEVSDLFPAGIDLAYIPSLRLVWVRAGTTRRDAYRAADTAEIPTAVRNHIRTVMGIDPYPAMPPNPDQPIRAGDIPRQLRPAVARGL